MDLYAWTTNDSSVNIKTVYTLSETPSGGDSLYDSSGNVVESIDDGSFETRYAIFGNYDAQSNSFKVELLAPKTIGGSND